MEECLCIRTEPNVGLERLGLTPLSDVCDKISTLKEKLRLCMSAVSGSDLPECSQLSENVMLTNETKPLFGM